MFVSWAKGVQEYVNFKFHLLFIIIFIIIDIIPYYFSQVIHFIQNQLDNFKS